MHVIVRQNLLWQLPIVCTTLLMTNISHLKMLVFVFKLLQVVKVKHRGRLPQPAIRLLPSQNHPRVDLHLSWVAESSKVVLLQLLRLVSRQRTVDVLLGYCVRHYLIILLSLLTNAMHVMVRFTLHYCVDNN